MTTINAPKTEKFVLVNVDFSAYSGQVALDKETLKDDIVTDIVSAGNLDTVPSESLKIFGTLRARARTLCLSRGTSFLGGYAIPLPVWPEIQNGLESIVAEFKKEASNFVFSYESLVQSQAIAWPKNGDLIRAKAHSRDWVETRFSANFSASFLSPAPGMDEAMGRQIEGLNQSACNEIAADAKAAIRAYKKGSRITRRMRSTLENMIDKLNSLAFINPELKSISDAIQGFIETLNIPTEGPLDLDEDKQSKIALILMTMTQPENLPDLASILKAEMLKVQAAHTPPENHEAEGQRAEIACEPDQPDQDQDMSLFLL